MRGNSVNLLNASYLTDVPEDSINPINLALSTTTFKNEQYILLISSSLNPAFLTRTGPNPRPLPHVCRRQWANARFCIAFR